MKSYNVLQDGKLNLILLSRVAEGIGPTMPSNQQVLQLGKVLNPTNSSCEFGR